MRRDKRIKNPDTHSERIANLLERQALRRLIGLLRRRYPQATVVGHRDLNPGKACPCYNAKAEY